MEIWKEIAHNAEHGIKNLLELTSEHKVTTALSIVLVSLVVILKAKRSNAIPTVNLWSVIYNMGKHPDLKTALAHKLLEPNYKDEVLIKLTCFPIFSGYILKNADGNKLFYSHSGLNLEKGYEWLLGNIRSKVFKEKPIKVIESVSVLTRLLKPARLSEWAGRILLPTITEKLAQQSEIDDLLSFNYNTVSTMAIRSFTEYCATPEQQQLLIEGVREADVETMMNKNPWHMAFPNLPALVNERERIYHKFTSTLEDIIVNYVTAHKEELDSMTTKKDRDGQDLVSCIIREAYDPITQTIQISNAVSTTAALLDAAVLNQYIATVTLLIHLNAHPDIKKQVEDALQPLVRFLKDNDLLEPGRKCESIPADLVENVDILDACLLETVRIGSTGWTFRKSTKEIVVSENRVIPNDALVLNMQGLVHFDDKINPDPYVFNPSRFLDENGKCVGGARAPHMFSGFGLGICKLKLGKHVCTGMKFASLQIKMLSAIILCKYDLEFAKPDYTLTSMLLGLSKPTEKVSVKLIPKAL
ncbi:hypothetical protein HK103_007055 [Boothiomyces macroporosus]|uniref:Cytochrome P450 n=1 Tax=Boothiomyces macroporosus TaxID=261099 RepID=A0AAD5Y1Q6_9FUNG|nr:hypothetical protein HK103_007055 [Boothiomyces macroporosus]